MSEPRAKRTHARRSCDLCKIRKTRCELPDLEVPSGPDPLPLDKSCHRCKVLALPCVVDDTGKKGRKRQRDDLGVQGDGGPSGSGQRDSILSHSPGRRAVRQPRQSNAANSLTANGVNHSLDLMHGFEPLEPTLANISHFTPSGPFGKSTPGDLPIPAKDPRPYGSESVQSKSMKLHGRPLELACAMLKVAYGKEPYRRKRSQLEVEDVDLDALVNVELRERLEPAMNQLRTYHPYLDTLPALFTNYTSNRSTSTSLLLATVLYLSSLALPAEPTLLQTRALLSSYITSLRDRVILFQQPCFVSIQALEILATHAPLGVLPIQLTNLRALDVARGQLAAASSISKALNYSGLFATFQRLHVLGTFHEADCWLWLSLCATQASMLLEDLVPKKPACLVEATDMVETFASPDNYDLWRNAPDPAATLGRLGVLDRLVRLSGVLDSVAKLRIALDMAVSNPAFDPVTAIVEEMQMFSNKMEEIDQRYEVLLGMIVPKSNGIESGLIAHRRLRRRYEANRVHATGLRALIATAFIPGHPLAFPNLTSTFGNPASKVAVALDRAANPTDIVPFLLHTSPAVQAVWQWGKHRGDISEQILVALAETVPSLVPGETRADIIPLHDIISIGLESAKVLMEMQAGKAVLARATSQQDDSLRGANFLHMMRQVSMAMRMVGALSQQDEDGGESIPTGCSNVVGSMLRMADEWSRALDSSAEADKAGEASGEDTSAPPSVGVKGVDDGGEPFPHPHQMPPQGFEQHGYMESSDRWMAGGHHVGRDGMPAPPPGPGQAGAASGGGYPPTPLDVLLSQMFNYSYTAQQQPGQQAQTVSAPGSAPANGAQDMAWK